VLSRNGMMVLMMIMRGEPGIRESVYPPFLTKKLGYSGVGVEVGEGKRIYNTSLNVLKASL